MNVGGDSDDGDDEQEKEQYRLTLFDPRQKDFQILFGVPIFEIRNKYF